jgi:hypothetical protein
VTMQTFEEWDQKIRDAFNDFAETYKTRPCPTNAEVFDAGYRARDAEIEAFRATLMDLVKEFNAKAAVPEPTPEAIAYAICAEKLFNALGAERKTGT